MKQNNSVTYYLLTLLLLLTSAQNVSAREFAVESFRLLTNDVSAFVNPVRDLNDDDCGLIKVLASEDFAFSTPLGIVKRIDKIGEIWLYVPDGSKKITIKHPQWGVLRDYLFPERVKGLLTYELVIKEPVKPVNVQSVPEPIVTTIRDTLVVTRIDTLVVRPVKKYVPLQFDGLVTASYGGRTKTLSGGLMLALMKRHGGFIHLSTDFGHIGSTIGECSKTGFIDGAMRLYSGRSRHSAFMVNAGAIHRLSERVALFEGLGYACNTLAWQLAGSEGGGYVKNTGYSIRGLSFEAGVMISYKRLRFSAAVKSIKGTDWFGSLGVGVRIGK